MSQNVRIHIDYLSVLLLGRDTTTKATFKKSLYLVACLQFQRLSLLSWREAGRGQEKWMRVLYLDQWQQTERQTDTDPGLGL